MPYGIVYHIFNTVNGRCYVGQTTRSLEDRWENHIGDMQRLKRPLYRAMKKYGLNVFVVTKLVDVSSQDELNAAELYFSEYFHALVPDGYCLKLGEGRGRHCEETKAKIRAKRREQDERTGAKSPRAGTGKRPFVACRCGNKFLLTYHDRKFCSRKCYAHFEHANMASRFAEAGISSRAKSVRDNRTGKVYVSARAAARELGIPWGSFGKIRMKRDGLVYIETGSERLLHTEEN